MLRNLLKEEFYKSNKGVVQYVLFAVMCLFSILLVVLAYYLMGLLGDLGFELVSWTDIQISMPSEGYIAGFVVLLVLIYITAEFDRGTLKNYLAVGFSRNQIFFAKFIKVIVIILGMLFLTQLVILTFSPFLLPASNINFWSNLGYYAYGLFAIFELVCFYVGISFVIRSVWGMIGVWMTLNVAISVIYSIPGYLPASVNSSFFKSIATFIEYACFSYQPSVAEKLFVSGATPTEIVFAILIPLIISGLSIFGGLYYFNKSDVK